MDQIKVEFENSKWRDSFMQDLVSNYLDRQDVREFGYTGSWRNSHTIINTTEETTASQIRQ